MFFSRCVGADSGNDPQKCCPVASSHLKEDRSHLSLLGGEISWSPLHLVPLKLEGSRKVGWSLTVTPQGHRERTEGTGPSGPCHTTELLILTVVPARVFCLHRVLRSASRKPTGALGAPSGAGEHRCEPPEAPQQMSFTFPSSFCSGEYAELCFQHIAPRGCLLSSDLGPKFPFCLHQHAFSLTYRAAGY